MFEIQQYTRGEGWETILLDYQNGRLKPQHFPTRQDAEHALQHFIKNVAHYSTDITNFKISELV